MEDWEANLQQVDKVLFMWMKKQRKAATDPEDCIGVLEEAGIYNPTDKSGLPFRNDLRDARKASGVNDSELFTYSTQNLRFEQVAKFQSWSIYRK